MQLILVNLVACSNFDPFLSYISFGHKTGHDFHGALDAMDALVRGPGFVSQSAFGAVVGLCVAVWSTLLSIYDILLCSASPWMSGRS